MPIGLLIALLAAAAVTGLCWLGSRLTLSGLRGDLIDRHPVCRTCHYDLTGHDVRPERCPECCADLRRPNMVRVGHRRINGARICFGMGSLVVAIGPIVYLGVASSTGGTAIAAPPAPAPALPLFTWRGAPLGDPFSDSFGSMNERPSRTSYARTQARDTDARARASILPEGRLAIPMVDPAELDIPGLEGADYLMLYAALGDRVGDTDELKRNLNPRLPDGDRGGALPPPRAMPGWEASTGSYGGPRPTARPAGASQRPVGRSTGSGAFRRHSRR